MSGWVQREAEIAAERANACDDAADAYDRLVAAVWEAVTVDTHEGPASVEVLLDAVRELRSIVEGRTTPPSDEEIAAHEARGWWLFMLRGYPDVTTTSFAREWAQHHRAHPEDGGRWWPLDAQKRPCAWPVVDR